MKKYRVNIFGMIMLVCMIIISFGSVSAKAIDQATKPNCPSTDPYLMDNHEFLQTLPLECKSLFREKIQKLSAAVDQSNVLPMAVGGPDDFGYTFDDTVTYSWISASTNSGVTGDDEFSSPINIGFNFPFYGLTQTDLYFSTNGLITFGSGSRKYNNYLIPSVNSPNNFIAPFWSDLLVGDYGNTGAIYYSQGGIAPNRYFVVEWRNVETLSDSYVFSFEAILYENGDIVIQHQSLPASYYSTVGIENSIGSDGLAYQYGSSDLSAPKAVHFYYPTTPTARVLVSPVSAGKFLTPGNTVSFTITITNIGNLGTDTYDLTTSSTWPVTFYASNGITPLTDTDADTVIDTGPITQGSSRDIVVKFTPPDSAQVGDNNQAIVTASPSLNIIKSKSSSLSMAIPANFANVYEEDSNGAMSFMTASPVGTNTYKTTSDYYYGYDTAVTQLPNGNYLYAWSKGRSVGGYWTSDIEFTILGGNGGIVRPVTNLTNSASQVYNWSPSIAVAPDGTIGVVWSRALNNNSSFNYNIYFAILNSSGSLTAGPTKITNNSVWGYPDYWTPTIAATDDNHFIMGWSEYFGSPSYSENIWYAVRNTVGTSVLAPTKFTSDNQSWAPILNSLTGGKAILTWSKGCAPYYAVINSNGSIFKTATSLNGSAYCNPPDAVLLPNGKTAAAWTTSNGVQYAILNTSYNIESGPTTASTPTPGGYGLSVTTDASSHVIMTWVDDTTDSNLVYALGDSTGSFVTAPMYFLTSSEDVYTSNNGQGNAPFMPPTISGNTGEAGVTLSYRNGVTATSDGSGNYVITVPYGWSGMVTPYKSDYTFTPINRSYSNVQSNQTSQNYTAQACVGCADIDVTIGGNPPWSYTVVPGEERREYYPISDGPVIVHSTNAMDLVSAIRLQSKPRATLYSFVETMGVPDGLLSYKYYFPTYNNTWGPLNSQLRFANINNTDITVRVTIGTQHWDYPVPANSERREYLSVSDGPVIIESLDPTKKIIAAIRLQSKPGSTLYSFSETIGIPVEQLSYRYYFPTYNNTWAPLNSQLRFGVP